MSAQAVIEFRGVGFTYPGTPAVTALHRSDLLISSGEFVTVVGPSGSGKSTFLNLCGLLDTPTTGTCLLDGIDVGRLGENQRASLRGRRIGFVFQSFHMLPYRTALENVMLALTYSGVPRKERESRSRDALATVGLAGRADAFPTRMSGGECQRVAIARAVVTSPSLLLCDEPTGNLDSAGTGAVLELLEELNSRGITILLITHDESVARRATRLITIRDGRMTEGGPA